MMSIAELVETDGYKKFMAKVYGWGASVVMVGALFKIQHYPGAGPMLVVGLLTEAVIFFFSAFEPVHAEIDWTLVYPELIPTPEGEEVEGIQDTTPLTTFLKEKLAGKIEGGAGGNGAQGGNALSKFDELLEQGKLGPELFERLGNNLEALNSNVSNMSDISNAAVATNSYVENINNATGSVSSLSGAFAASAQKLSQSVDGIAASAQQTANSIAEEGTKTATMIANAGAGYQQVLQGLNANFSVIGDTTRAQAEQQEALSKNLSALNAVYEMQLKNSSSNLDATEKITAGINSIMSDLQSTANDVAQYKSEISKLSQNLAALNTVYGNMLNAMSIK